MSEAMTVDSRAVIDPAAQLGQGVSVGPFCVLGPDVIIGDGCKLGSHVVVEGPTEIGAETIIAPMASIGGPPQDLKYEGGATRLELGARNNIREFVTLNRGTEQGGGVTRIGDDNLFMAYAHVGHDCQVGNRNIFANAATLAGHVDVGDDATIGAFSAVHQYCRVANHAFIGGYSVVTRDALPWVVTAGNRARANGLNRVGLRRKGYSKESRDALKTTYHTLFQSKLLLAEAMSQIEDRFGAIEEVQYFIEFIRSSKRGVCR